MRDLRNQIKWIILVISVAAILIFTVQNAALVDIRFLGWVFEIRRVVIILLSFVFGALVGWLFGVTPRRKHNKH